MTAGWNSVTIFGMDGSAIRRYLCSELVTLRFAGQSLILNLEEIGPAVAVLESEEPLPVGVEAEMDTGSRRFSGTLISSEETALGWRIEFEFAQSNPWSIDRFRPSHLLDPSTLTETGRV
jgi:hypothetical protein